MTDLLNPEHHSPSVDPGQPSAQPATSLATASMLLATTLSGLFGGFFLTYSASVQLGLARVGDLTYVRTFQAINDTTRNPMFAIMFFGCVPATALASFVHRRAARRTVLALAVGGVMCAAVVVITFVFNVPLNDDLADWADPTAEQATVARAQFETVWNRWNLARTVLSVGGAVAVAYAAVLSRQAGEGRRS